MSEPKKDARHQAILEIVRAGLAHNHEDLVAQLKKRGFDVTQTTISRDLVELRIAKQNGVYVVADSLLTSSLPSWELTLRQLGKSCKTAGPNLVVVRVQPGAAHLVASQVESQLWKGVVGIVAGDDTFFIACETARDSKKIAAKLDALILS